MPRIFQLFFSWRDFLLLILQTRIVIRSCKKILSDVQKNCWTSKRKIHKRRNKKRKKRKIDLEAISAEICTNFLFMNCELNLSALIRLFMCWELIIRFWLKRNFFFCGANKIKNLLKLDYQKISFFNIFFL